MKKYFAVLLSISMLFCSSFLVYGAEEKQTNKTQTEQEKPTVLGEFEKLKDANWLGISQEQKLEDFDYLYQTLQENYPYFHVVKRMIGIDLEENYKQTRELIQQSETDAQFFVLVDKFTRSAQSLGHLGIFNSLWYLETAQGYQSIVESYQAEGIQDNRLEKIAAAYNNIRSIENYKKMNTFMRPVYDEVMAYCATEETGNNTDTNQIVENITTKIIEDGKIAYIKINSFPSSDVYDEDKKILFDFYEKVKDYEHVIFDFTENGGGAMSYFDNLIVAPNIDKPLSTKAYSFVKNGDYNNQFMDFSEYKPTSKLPKLPRINQEDLKDLDLFETIEYKIEPTSNQKILNGKLWMLVSKNVFSSSEYAAMFSKATKFATLVGTETGGDGIGSDPLPIVLPNSAFIIRYSPIYGTTPDGAGSQEFGTMPDILSKEGENPLDTCLKAIKNEK